MRPVASCSAASLRQHVIMGGFDKVLFANAPTDAAESLSVKTCVLDVHDLVDYPNSMLAVADSSKSIPRAFSEPYLHL